MTRRWLIVAVFGWMWPSGEFFSVRCVRTWFARA